MIDIKKEINGMRKTRRILIIILLILSIPQFSYRFKHPEKTETQLMIGFFEAYKEFFNGSHNK